MVPIPMLQRRTNISDKTRKYYWFENFDDDNQIQYEWFVKDRNFKGYWILGYPPLVGAPVRESIDIKARLAASIEYHWIIRTSYQLTGCFHLPVQSQLGKLGNGEARPERFSH